MKYEMYVCIIAIVVTLTHFNTIQILFRNSSLIESRARGGFPELEILPWFHFLRARGELKLAMKPI